MISIKPMHTFVLIVVAITTALIAGLFYAYSCSVNPGLSRLSDAQYIAAMQSINRAIVNPLFMLSFMGTLVMLPLSVYLHYGVPVMDRFYLLLVATVIYAVGVFGVTIFGNVPLNNALDKVNLQLLSSEELYTKRMIFEGPWNNLHRIRSIASFLTLLCVVLACLCDKNLLAQNLRTLQAIK
jgi:uncharacterized membrane protein